MIIEVNSKESQVKKKVLNEKFTHQEHRDL